MRSVDGRAVWACATGGVLEGVSGGVGASSSGGAGRSGESAGHEGAPLSLSEVKEHVRRAGEAQAEVHLEVNREELLHVRERVNDVSAHARTCRGRCDGTRGYGC